jgi:DNA invertase Pin-like site-specific DNA recombinase
MTNSFAYCRTSSLTNSEGDTFVRQMKAIKRYAASNDIEIVRGFEEVISGTKEWENRPAWVEMMESLNGVRTIVIEGLDRLARDLMVQEHIIEDLKRREITLISVREPDLGGSDPTRILIRQILGCISSYERAMIVAKLRGARERKRVSNGTGKCEGRKAFGDRPGELSTIDAMRKYRSEGSSYALIAEYLNVSKVPTRTGKPWYASVVRDVLQRESGVQ